LTPITKEGASKSGVTVSPNGTRIAYSTEGPALPGTIEDAYDVRRYLTHVLSASGEELFLIPGNHPYFLNDASLLVLNERGFEIYNMETGSSNATVDDLAFFAVERPVYGGGEAFIAVNPITSERLFMRFASQNPVLLEHIGTLPADDRLFFALGEGVRWEGRAENGTFTLTRFDGGALSDGAQVLSLPASVLAPLIIIP